MDEASIYANRVVIRCSHCHLNQFETKSGLCRKCRKSLFGGPLQEVQKIYTPPPVASRVRRRYPDIGFAIKLLRLANGMSQNDLAEKTGWLQQHISVVENGRKQPRIEAIESFAAALNATPYALITIAEACV